MESFGAQGLVDYSTQIIDVRWASWAAVPLFLFRLALPFLVYGKSHRCLSLGFPYRGNYAYSSAQLRWQLKLLIQRAVRVVSRS